MIPTFLELTDDVVNVMHTEVQSELQYRLAWARTYLKAIGCIENSSRGVWTLTSVGSEISESEIEPLIKRRREDWSDGPAVKKSIGSDIETSNDLNESRWKVDLIEQLLKLSPHGFEKLSQRLLRESGFVNVEVIGKSGDGGIDGIGIYKPSLISFVVYFQCKRYRGSVGAGAIRDFRGAMQGRGERGVLITTGTFTRDSQTEATRDGAPRVDLIDGDQLCELLFELKLGVEHQVSPIFDPSFFNQFDSD